MMKKIILSLSLIAAAGAYAQNTGIGTTKPQATLDVTGRPTDALVLDGIKMPEITGEQLRAKAYTGNQMGTQVYVSIADPSPTGQTINVTAPGVYYFDGSKWKKGAGDDWSLNGNAITAGQFLGTTNSQDILFKRFNIAAGLISTGNTSFGLGTPQIAGNLYNTAIGVQALNAVTTGGNNSALGAGSLQFLTTGRDNSAFGNNSLSRNITGTENTAMGATALSNATGNDNSAFGSLSGSNISTGVGNTTIGRFAGYNITSGSYNISLGASTQIPNPEGNYQLNIGNSIYGFNLGDGYATNDLIGIQTKTPVSTLDVNGSLSLPIIVGSTLSNTDYTFVYNGTANGNIMLPPVTTSKGRIYNFVYAGIQYTINTTDTITWRDQQNIKGLVLGSSNFQKITMQCDGTKWYVIDYIENVRRYDMNITAGIIMKAPNATCYRYVPDNSGQLVGTSITCP